MTKMEKAMPSPLPRSSRSRIAPAVLGLSLLATLAACGADGAPEPPTQAAAPSATGISISGEGRFGAQTRL